MCTVDERALCLGFWSVAAFAQCYSTHQESGGCDERVSFRKGQRCDGARHEGVQHRLTELEKDGDEMVGNLLQEVKEFLDDIRVLHARQLSLLAYRV